MHVAHFHPPRAVAVTLIAGVLAIVITLTFASRISDMSAGSAALTGRVVPVSGLRPAPPSTVTRAGTTPVWLASPFSPLLGSEPPSRWSWAGGARVLDRPRWPIGDAIH